MEFAWLSRPGMLRMLLIRVVAAREAFDSQFLRSWEECATGVLPVQQVVRMTSVRA